MSFAASSLCTSAASSLFQCLSRPGPSRLAARLQPCSSCAKHIRHASSSASEPSTDSDAAEELAVLDAPENSGPSRSAPASQGKGYDNWLRSVGRQFKDAPNNGPNWLGGNVVSTVSHVHPFLLICRTAAIPHQPHLPATTAAFRHASRNDLPGILLPRQVLDCPRFAIRQCRAVENR